MTDSLVARLEQYFPAARLKTRLIDRHAYSSDASFYTLVPRAIVFPETVEEIKLLFRLAADLGTSLTFRTGGTATFFQRLNDSSQ